MKKLPAYPENQEVAGLIVHVGHQYNIHVFFLYTNVICTLAGYSWYLP